MIFFIQLLANLEDYFRWRVVCLIISLHLLIVHLLDEGLEPRLEQAVVVVGDDEVPDTVVAHTSEFLAIKVEVTEEVVGEELHDVLFNSARRRYNGCNHFVLTQIPDIFAHATGCHIGRVA